MRKIEKASGGGGSLGEKISSSTAHKGIFFLNCTEKYNKYHRRSCFLLTSSFTYIVTNSYLELWKPSQMFQLWTLWSTDQLQLSAWGTATEERTVCDGGNQKLGLKTDGGICRYSPVVTVCTTGFNSHECKNLPTQCIHVFCVDLRTNSTHYSPRRTASNESATEYSCHESKEQVDN